MLSIRAKKMLGGVSSYMFAVSESLPAVNIEVSSLYGSENCEGDLTLLEF